MVFLGKFVKYLTYEKTTNISYSEILVPDFFIVDEEDSEFKVRVVLMKNFEEMKEGSLLELICERRV